MIFDYNESQRLKFVRCIAVGMILLTHISQEYEIGLEEWANTGVQVFLVISGFLLGQKDIGNWRIWFRKRFVRLIPPYYAVLILTALAYWLFLNINIVDMRFLAHFSTLHFLIFPEYPVWGGHLWYISAIVLCYAVFPLVYQTRRIPAPYFVLFIFFLSPPVLAGLFYKLPLSYRLSADIYAFVIGFAIAHLFGTKPPLYLTAVFAGITLFGMILKQTPLLNSLWNTSVADTFAYLGMPWIRTLLGVSVFLIFYHPIFNQVSQMHIVNFTDRYSYEIYLCHKNFILGPLSLLHITGIQSFNILIALCVSVSVAVFIQKFSGMPIWRRKKT
jgi:peptidoglycan/LPS O-acetylase OafA/YrhL